MRKVNLAVAAVSLFVIPVGTAWAQTTTTSSTTTTTVMTTTTTTTTLPICVPGNPTHQVGATCQLPGLECIVLNPPPGCGNFANPPGDEDEGAAVVLVHELPAPGPTPPAAQPVGRRIALTG